jgi:hypothetical protein
MKTPRLPMATAFVLLEVISRKGKKQDLIPCDAANQLNSYQ